MLLGVPTTLVLAFTPLVKMPLLVLVSKRVMDSESPVLLVTVVRGRRVLPEPQFTPQPADGATYAEKIGAADRELHLDDPVDAWRRVRALSPHIGAWTTVEGRRLTIWRARLEEGRFVPEEVQPEGRRRMSYDDFRRGLRT